MKFTQTDAAKKISGILTRGGKDQQLSDRTIAENIDSLMKALVNDETELDDFVKQVEPMFKTWQANAKKDSSDFISKWKEEHPETAEKATDPEPAKPTESPELKALMDRIAALEEDKKESDRKSAIAQKKQELTAKMKEKGVKDDEWLSDFLSEVNISEDMDVDAKTEKWLKVYNKSKANKGNAAPPANPTGGGGDNKDTLADVAALAKQRNEALKL